MVLANGAAWSVSGSVLDITMMAGKTITVASTASVYTFTVSGLTATDTNTWTSGSSPYVTASGATATVSATGKTNFTQINIHQTSGQTGTSVAFVDSGANNYVTPISVTLGSSPSAVTFAGTTSFTASNSLSVTTDAYLVVSPGASVSTVNGNLALQANVADTSVAGAAFAYPGIEVNNATVQVTGSGLLDLEGRGGEGSNTSPYGVYVRSGGQVKGGTSGSNQVRGWGPTNGTISGNYGVYVYNGTGTTYSTITTNGGNLAVTGTGRGLITAGSDVGAGVFVNGGGIITAGGVGTVDVIGTAGTSNTVGGNFGVYVKGAGASSSYQSQITSGGGQVTVTGTGGGSGTASNGWGVAVANGGLISAGGSGTVTVSGTAGTTASGNAQYGVCVTGYYSGTGSVYSTITSGGGTVSITGTGGGTGTAASDAGVALTFGGMVTSGGNGNVSVTGTGGDSTGSGNYGVYVSGSPSQLTSGGSGTVTVTGYGGGGSASGSSYATGVYVSQGGTVTSGGTGKVMVTGTGNTRTPSTSSANHGVYLASSSSGIARITSGGGDVEVRGTGGGAVSSGTSAGYGVNLSAGSLVTSGGSGNVTVIGTGATAAGGTNNYGVNVNGTSTYSSVVYKSTITSGGSGAVSVSGTGGGTGASTSNYGVNVGSSLSTDNGVVTSGGNGTVTVTGQGGTTPTGSSNYGVYLAGSNVQISSGGTGLVTVTGTGGGSGNSSTNWGIGLNNNPTITSGAGGSVSVTGQGGTASTGNSNHGFYSSNSFTVTCGAGDGTVTVTGTGGGSGASSGNYGISLVGASGSTGLISSGGSGSVTVTGTGGNTSSANTGNNYGIYLTNGTTVTSGGGNVVVNGAGGGNGGTFNAGVRMAGVSTITAGGSGTVTVNGTGGASTTGTGSNFGVQIATSTGYGILSGPGPGGGNVTVNATEGGGGSGSTVSVGLTVSSGTLSTASNGGNVTIKTNSIHLATTNAIQTKSGSSVTIEPLTSGVGFNLGVSANNLGGPIGISSTELGYISSDTINLGNSSTGPITVSAAMTVPSSSNLSLATASSSAGLTPTNTSGTSLTLTSGKTLDLSNVASLNIDVSGTTLGSGYKQLSVAGAPVSLAGISLNLSGAYTPVGGDVFTIVAAPACLSGTFSGLADGATVVFNGRTLSIDYTATTVTLTDPAPKVTQDPANQTVTYGDPATFTAAASGTPSPTVQWQLNTGSGWSDVADAATTTLSLTPSVSQNGHQYRAVFTNTYGSTNSAPATLTVNRASTTTSVASSANPSNYGSSVTFTATVTSGATGTVTFQDGAATLGTGTLSSGTATFSTSSLSVASHSITAVYEGDTNYAGSTSSVLTQTVNQATDVTISGTATQGQTLTAANDLDDVTGTVSYQWNANGTAISGAIGETYVLTEAEVGKTITVTANYLDGHGTAQSKTSDATAAVVNVNDLPSGSVTISGTATQGQTLTAANDLDDADGLGTIGYQWNVNGSAISDATAATYVLTEAEVGKTITVTASYTDGHDTAESKTSSATTAVVNVNDLPVGSVTISGTATQGQTLTAANDLDDADGLGTIGYQWNANGSAISGATAATYVLTEAEVGKTITVTASYTDGHDTAESKTSSATTAVVNVNDLPSGSVTISGAATQGQTLTAANDLVDADGKGTVRYQWNANGTAISGATGATYVLTEAEVGKTITVTASYTDGHDTAESKTSDPTAAVVNVNDLPSGSVTVSGTAIQGQTLTAANDLGDVDGLGTVRYQWNANSTPISGATGTTYVLTEAEVGKTITVTASYTDGHDTAESKTSSATAAVKPPTAPLVESVQINDGAAQRSMVTRLVVTFDQVVIIGAGAFQVQLLEGGSIGLNAVQVDTGGRSVVTLTFVGAGLDGDSLADGNYALTIAADKVHAASGVLLDGDASGAAGGDFQFGEAAADRFFRFFGDSNGDRLVNTTDLALFRAALGKREGQKGYLDWFDYDADGDVDSAVDYSQFLIRYRARYLCPAGSRPTIAVVR